MSKWTRRKFITVTSVAAVAAAELAAQQTPQRPKKKGPTRYAVHPAIGVARLGNSPDEFYLEPETIGGLPIECTADGTPKMDGGRPVFVKKFKDDQGRIRRQGAQFRVFAFDSNDPYDPGREVTLDDAAVESIEWTVHLANKKGVWYNNDQFIGNVYLAGDKNAETENANYYPNPDDPPTPLVDASLRNWYIQGEENRQKQLIIDPGLMEVAADRMERNGIESLATPGALAARIRADLDQQSPAPGQIVLQLRGVGKDKTVRTLDTFVNSVVSQSNAGKERRVDGLATKVIEVATSAGALSDLRPIYALGIFGVGFVLAAVGGVAVWRRLSASKVQFEEEANIDAILESTNWSKPPEAFAKNG